MYTINNMDSQFVNMDGDHDQGSLLIESVNKQQALKNERSKREKKRVDEYKYKKKYTKETMEYTINRKTKEDPITWEDYDFEENDPRAFKFEYMWNPYTGKRSSKKDPYGALYFNPADLLHHFYTFRLLNLWVDEVDETGGYYQGRYGDAVGIGSTFEVVSRGKFIEWYLFRLPIIDCYIPEGQTKQSVSMGPRLTFDEIKEIDEKVQTHWVEYYKSKFRKRKVPSLLKIYELWTKAVSKHPINTENIPLEQRDDAISVANRDAVNELRKLK